MGAVRSRLRRWHVWLGWIVGAADPAVGGHRAGHGRQADRGGARRASAARAEPMRMATPPVAAASRRRARIKALALERARRRHALGGDAAGRDHPPRRPGQRRAAAAAVRRRRGARSDARATPATAKVQSATPHRRGPAADRAAPAVAAWKVAMDDGTHFYVDAGSGAIVARRTRWWRFYDLMWGFHIMDLKTARGCAQPADHRLRDRRAGDERLALVPAADDIRRRRRPKCRGLNSGSTAAARTARASRREVASATGRRRSTGRA